ncbi:MAG: prolyl oligopeptidase family serine peptidase [Bacteroidetes Order II. Incertae sedis bacterium]|jgi:predicted peptidase|nr:prolyl oligopeptidase family serine peptidase [Bacteroidetes Order II. bacterium]MBT4053276.1 prolyl oligopeptidase family serine peptidase [Bacteroidetes Order II. bacterium]MBT4601496.1 prolyl oligopeptidase family serine peptidase [Bacteroidetes Order II. bacterium]MBT5249993.1 prolyl oligopeptidase family serine peptidase [Bacteroidetes Order II. bacterium]MBT6200593.1 prolyl oligopeptidase family serine peptidase [Bacteroidetes Order II. bacterium]
MKGVLVLFAWMILSSAQAQTPESGFYKREVLRNDGIASIYQVYVPLGYTAEKEWPVILFLNGYGEQGEDGDKQVGTGLGPALQNHPESWPAVVVFPQNPTGTAWHGASSEMAMRALAQTQREFNTDENRVYLTGLSMGGYGTWYTAVENEDVFAAIVPICGFVNPIREYYPAWAPAGDAAFPYVAERLSNIPIWIFHGDADSVVPVDQARSMNLALQALEADVRYSELMGVGHNAWDHAYSDKAMIKWLFEQKKDEIGEKLSN